MIKFQDLARTRKKVSVVFLSIVPSPLYNLLSEISTFRTRKKQLNNMTSTQLHTWLQEYGDKDPGARTYNILNKFKQ